MGDKQNPKNLLRFIKSYLRNRILLYDAETGVLKYKVTGGLPQGLVLGHVLWNVMVR